MKQTRIEDNELNRFLRRVFLVSSSFLLIAVEFDWKNAFIKAEKSLDITLFLVQLKFILSKPGLKKARKASQFSKR